MPYGVFFELLYVEGSIFEVKRWNLRSKKFEWMQGAAPDL